MGESALRIRTDIEIHQKDFKKKSNFISGQPTFSKIAPIFSFFLLYWEVFGRHRQKKNIYKKEPNERCRKLD